MKRIYFKVPQNRPHRKVRWKMAWRMATRIWVLSDLPRGDPFGPASYAGVGPESLGVFGVWTRTNPYRFEGPVGL